MRVPSVFAHFDVIKAVIAHAGSWAYLSDTRHRRGEALAISFVDAVLQARFFVCQE
jgi:hypothetical protein